MEVNQRRQGEEGDAGRRLTDADENRLRAPRFKIGRLARVPCCPAGSEWFAGQNRPLLIPVGKKRLFLRMQLNKLTSEDRKKIAIWNNIPHVLNSENQDLADLIFFDFIKLVLGDLFWKPPCCREEGCMKRAEAVGPMCGHQTQCREHQGANCRRCQKPMVLMAAPDDDEGLPVKLDYYDAILLANGFFKLTESKLIVHTEQQATAILSNRLQDIESKDLPAILCTNNIELEHPTMPLDACARLKLQDEIDKTMPTPCRYCHSGPRVILMTCGHDQACLSCITGNNRTCMDFECDAPLEFSRDIVD